MANIPTRIGFYSLRRTAQRLCKYIGQFTPLIQRTFPESAALLAALIAANEACALLDAEIAKVEEPGV